MTVTTSAPVTKGEELFKVHLQRTSAPDPHPEDAEDDHDVEPPRHPDHSIGEELWNVHLKRSQGLEPDYDIDDPGAQGDAKPAAKGSKVEPEGKAHYNLRSMDKKAQ